MRVLLGSRERAELRASVRVRAQEVGVGPEVTSDIVRIVDRHSGEVYPLLAGAELGTGRFEFKLPYPVEAPVWANTHGGMTPREEEAVRRYVGVLKVVHSEKDTFDPVDWLRIQRGIRQIVPHPYLDRRR